MGEPVVCAAPALDTITQLQITTITNEFMPREIIQLQCADCKDKNYSTKKNRKTTPDRLEMKKFCRKCRKHTAHKEVK